MQYLKLHALVHSLWSVLSQFTVTNQNKNTDYILLKKETRLIKELLKQIMCRLKVSNLFNIVCNLIET